MKKSRIEPTVKIKKPRLYRRTRPKTSESRPQVTSKTAVTTRYPISDQSSTEVCPGASGSIPIPRKMSGSAISTMLLFNAAIKMPRVVFESAIHL